MIEVVARHMVGGQRHEHIAEVRYKDSNGNFDVASRENMVKWLDESRNNEAIVRSRMNPNYYVFVGTVHPSYGAPYIRTHADGTWTDNLLSLPEY